MKKRILLLTVIFGVVLSLWGSTVVSAQDERDGGTLRIFTSQTVGRVDPTTTQANYLQVIAYQFFAQLVRYQTGTFEVVPDLAESWTVSDDGLTYTFVMRPNLTFHDGSPITLNDVVFSLDYARRPESVWATSYLQFGHRDCGG